MSREGDGRVSIAADVSTQVPEPRHGHSERGVERAPSRAIGTEPVGLAEYLTRVLPQVTPLRPMELDLVAAFGGVLADAR